MSELKQHRMSIMGNAKFTNMFLARCLSKMMTSMRNKLERESQQYELLQMLVSEQKSLVPKAVL